MPTASTDDEHYRRIFEAAGDALVIVDPDCVIVEANPMACRMYGYTREELVGLHSMAVTHPAYHHLARTFPETIRAGGSHEARAVNLRKDGTPFHIEERASGILYRGRMHILSVIRDITAQVRAEQMLREREEQYRRIFLAKRLGGRRS